MTDKPSEASMTDYSELPMGRYKQLSDLLRRWKPGDRISYCHEAASALNEAATTIRTLLAEREEAYVKGWSDAIEAGAKACGAEQLGDPQDEADAAYDRGVEHCVAAIRALAKP